MFKNKGGKKQRGFTLIELLVVIAIIGFLSTLAMVALSSAREKSRDAKRVQSVSAITKALALHLNSSSGDYPTSNGECLSNSSPAGQALSASEAMKQMPLDPSWGTESPNPNIALDNDGYCYYYTSDEFNIFTIDYFLEGDSATGRNGHHQADPTKMY